MRVKLLSFYSIQMKDMASDKGNQASYRVGLSIVLVINNYNQTSLRR